PPQAPRRAIAGNERGGGPREPDHTPRAEALNAGDAFAPAGHLFPRRSPPAAVPVVGGPTGGRSASASMARPRAPLPLYHPALSPGPPSCRAGGRPVRRRNRTVGESLQPVPRRQRGRTRQSARTSRWPVPRFIGASCRVSALLGTERGRLRRHGAAAV